MRVTDQMRRKAVEAIAKGYGERHVIDVVLEAALADVPEPLQHRLRAEAYEELSQAHFRIADLEWKLAKVREELEDSEPMNDADWRRVLHAILDAKKTP